VSTAHLSRSCAGAEPELSRSTCGAEAELSRSTNLCLVFNGFLPIQGSFATTLRLLLHLPSGMVECRLKVISIFPAARSVSENENAHAIDGFLIGPQLPTPGLSDFRLLTPDFSLPDSQTSGLSDFSLPTSLSRLPDFRTSDFSLQTSLFPTPGLSDFRTSHSGLLSPDSSLPTKTQNSKLSRFFLPLCPNNNCL
jgi:hypothetical protein